MLDGKICHIFDCYGLLYGDWGALCKTVTKICASCAAEPCGQNKTVGVLGFNENKYFRKYLTVFNGLSCPFSQNNQGFSWTVEPMLHQNQKFGQP